MRRKKDHDLAPDDRILWEKVARTVTPLGPPRGLMTALEAVDFEKLLEAPSLGAPKPQPPQPGATGRNPLDQGSAHAFTSAPAIEPKSKTAKPPETIDDPIQRRIAKGKLAIEARIDLHGMTQDEAHGLLMSFIARAAQRHLRTVLVITGKGRSSKSEGVLKRAVPLWLAQPGFAIHVSGYADAAQGHGGGGAIYIRLRKPGLGSR
jgi:DNA-nicking Smr family endonuclease